jgi:hypothetical protein
MSEKKYKGYGYHGGGRKPSSPDGQPRRTSMTISGTRSEIEALRKLAKNADKSVSRFVIESIMTIDNMCKLIPIEEQKAILKHQIRTAYDAGLSYREIAYCLCLRYDEVMDALRDYEGKE